MQNEVLDNGDLMQRLKMAVIEEISLPEKKSLLGLFDKPKLGLNQAFDRFWAHIRDEWQPLGPDQRRTKRNVYQRAISNFAASVGDVALYDISREHALTLRSWFMERVASEEIKPYTGNREISALRRMVSVNFEIDSSTRTNPFHKVRLKDGKQATRQPFSTEFIRDELLAPGALPDLPQDLHLLLRLLVNTGMRPSEGVGLEMADFFLDAEVPHVHVRANATHALKTDHSERQLPLVGVSLKAARRVVAQGGWGKWLGKNMYVTTLINRHFRETGLVTTRSQSLYSLRHWFQDQLTKRDVVDRAQAQLMGHKFQRPKYGYGKDLAELQEIIATFAIE